VVAALEEYVSALKAGQAPDREEFQARHAEIAAALAECLDGLEWMRGAAPGPGPAVTSPVVPAVAGAGPGDYQILREVGRGGMGEVYEAVQLSLNRRVALKVLPFAARVHKGEAQPPGAAERLSLARFCREHKTLYACAARFYSEAFAEPKLAEELLAQHRYNAACAAALAGCGQGEDGGKLDDKERTRWRKQALDWLAALWTKQAEKGTAQALAGVQKALRQWQNSNDLAGLRDREALARLPADEQNACTQLWADVATLLKKAEALAEGGRAMNAVSPQIKSHGGQFARFGPDHRSSFGSRCSMLRSHRPTHQTIL
jgi:hypothetical protein